MSNDLWSEKYRPTSLHDLVLDLEQYEILSNFSIKTLPHLIFSGPPGCGKTTTALVLAKTLLKDSRSYVELNASDNRGIGMISQLVENFCRICVDDEIMIIILDEADNITRKAQQMLLSHIMDQMKHIRCIFTCNGPSELIQGIQSASLHLPFCSVNHANMIKRLSHIGNLENYNIEEQHLSRVFELSANDARKSINNLQLLHLVTDNDPKQITNNTINKYIREPNILIIANIIASAVIPNDVITNNTIKKKNAEEEKKMLYQKHRFAFVDKFHTQFISAHGYVDFITIILNVYLKGEQLHFFESVLKDHGIVLNTNKQTKLLELTSKIYFQMMETYESPLLMTKYLYGIFKIMNEDENISV